MAVMEPVANTGAFDCTFLDDISEETILENLRLRFKIGKVKIILFSFSAHFLSAGPEFRKLNDEV